MLGWRQWGRPFEAAGRVTGGRAVRAERGMVAVSNTRHAVLCLLGVISAVSGLACTSTQKVPTADRGTLATEACFNLRTVDSFSPLGNQFVYLRTLTDERYLLTLDAVYVTLPFATGITIADNFSRICSDSGARLTYVNAGVPVFCRIVRVEAVESKEVAQQVVKDRRTPEPKPRG
jgi:hypothetical protein